MPPKPEGPFVVLNVDMVIEIIQTVDNMTDDNGEIIANDGQFEILVFDMLNAVYSRQSWANLRRWANGDVKKPSGRPLPFGRATANVHIIKSSGELLCDALVAGGVPQAELIDGHYEIKSAVGSLAELQAHPSPKEVVQIAVYRWANPKIKSMAIIRTFGDRTYSIQYDGPVSDGSQEVIAASISLMCSLFKKAAASRCGPFIWP